MVFHKNMASMDGWMVRLVWFFWFLEDFNTPRKICTTGVDVAEI